MSRLLLQSQDAKMHRAWFVALVHSAWLISPQMVDVCACPRCCPSLIPKGNIQSQLAFSILNAPKWMATWLPPNWIMFLPSQEISMCFHSYSLLVQDRIPMMREYGQRYFAPSALDSWSYPMWVNVPNY